MKIKLEQYNTETKQFEPTATFDIIAFCAVLMLLVGLAVESFFKYPLF